MARNVVAHYRAFADQLPEATRDDISLRWIESILATDQARHGTPVIAERALPDRVQGCCRDHTLLAVAALRHHGVPARSRVGFAPYLSPTYNHDHVVVEAWLDGAWVQFDPEFAPAPTGQLLSAAEVWLGHRAGTLDVDRFGVAEGIGIGGDWFVHGYVIGEVAHRFGDELLLWDLWGAMCGDLRDAPTDDIALVDDVARLLLLADAGDLGAERDLFDRYRDDDRLHPSATIRSTSPYGGLFEVDLTARTSERVG
jgi:hypothetical protein